MTRFGKGMMIFGVAVMLPIGVAGTMLMWSSGTVETSWVLAPPAVAFFGLLVFIAGFVIWGWSE